MKISNACLSAPITATAVVLPVFNAGTDATDTICDTLMVDLRNYLGAFDSGGTFIDADSTGALSGNMFNANAVAKNKSYSFRYEGGVPQCSDTANISLFVDYCSISLQERVNSAILVYPNPTEGTVFIQLKPESSSRFVELYAIIGHFLFKRAYEGNKAAEIELDHLPEGVYTLRVIQDDDVLIQRIVKQ